jgi:YD repeat-containing protein
MKTINGYTHVSMRIVITVIFVSFIFSCSKNNNDPSTAINKYCNEIDWSNSIGLSGYFKGALTNGTFGLTSESITEDGISKIVTLTRDASSHLINGSGLTYSYNQDKLVKIVASDGTASGSGTFTFDSNSHLTNVDIVNSDETSTSSFKYTYTYDTNDDPVKILGHLVSTDISGTTTADYDITADYLTDKPNYLYLVPEVTPFTIYFAYGFYLSKHLINKWVIKINGIDSDGTVIPTINFTQQYTYTYDGDGKVSTMVHTGNNNNKFTFTYLGCN